jgi:hypothetical protein
LACRKSRRSSLSPLELSARVISALHAQRRRQ